MIAAADRQSKEHDCASHCCRETRFDDKCSTCPYAQTWHSDALLQINKFEVVMETFHPRNLLHEDFSADRNRLYLQFSFDNAEILISKDTFRKPDFKRQTRSSGNGKEKSKTCAFVKGLNEEANASLDKRKFGFMCKIIFAVRICEVAALRRVQEELCYPCGVEIKVVAVYRNEIQNATGNKSFSSYLNVSDFLSEFKLQRKTAALKLVKKNLCWSQFLHAGCFYVITETVPNEKSSRILQNGNLQTLINVTCDMLLDRICWCERCSIAPSEGAEYSMEIFKALDELKDDFLKTDRLHTVDTVLGEASCREDECGNSLKARYECIIVLP